MDKKKFGTGAMPPPSLAWQMGKTAASIDFVRNAENMISWLQEQVEAVKDGSVILYDGVNINVSGWEKALKEPSLIERACDSFTMEYLDGHNVFLCGISMKDGEEIILVQALDISNLPKEYLGFRVVAQKSEKPVPLGN